MKYQNKTITKRKDRKNSWIIRFRYNNRQYAVYGKTQKDIVKKYKTKLKELKEPKQTIIKEYTLKEWYNEYMKLYKIGVVKDTTIRKDNFTFEKLKKFYNYKLKDITALQIQELISKQENDTPKKNIYLLLNAMLEKAYINDLVNKNIMKLVDKPKYKAKEKQALTKEEETNLINACKTHKQGNFILLCLYQGLRRGECLALKVNDIDFKNNTLRIDESINQHTNRTDTKNEQSNRTMPLFNKTKELLKDIIKNKNENDYIFDTSFDKVDKDLKSITEELKIKHITIHSLRHTFITRCQENNIPLFVVQKWVGHEKGSVVTTKIYTHLNKETENKYTNIINNI